MSERGIVGIWKNCWVSQREKEKAEGERKKTNEWARGPGVSYDWTVLQTRQQASHNMARSSDMWARRVCDQISLTKQDLKKEGVCVCVRETREAAERQDQKMKTWRETWMQQSRLARSQEL